MFHAPIECGLVQAADWWVSVILRRQVAALLIKVCTFKDWTKLDIVSLRAGLDEGVVPLLRPFRHHAAQVLLKFSQPLLLHHEQASG